MIEAWSSFTSLCFLSLFLSPRTPVALSAPDFSLYLHSILKNHTAHACEGDLLVIKCPSRTSVAVLSAFYGRRVPNKHLCPAPNANITAEEEDTDCTSSTALEKVLSECQDERSCHIPVLAPVFGPDPCPLTTKYLLVSYKCKPEHHHTRLVCENERLRLMCKNESVLAIYSATFGHLLHGSPNCPEEPGSKSDMECLSAVALRKVSRRCHGRENCSIFADTQTFGDPCFPGTRKHLRVSFTCVPRYLLEDVGRGSTDPFMISDLTHGLPERVALYFVSGICAGLVFLLCLFGLRSTLVRDVKDLVSDLNYQLKASRRQRKELMDDLFDEDVSDTSSFRHLTQSYRATETLSPSTLSVELVEREVQQTRAHPNGDIWPQLDSSPYAIHKIKTYSN
ncbi:PREDICTED: protein eva-1 homolog C-like isoform X2 [Poecilia mexicana]|uniref:protein eva-1 homolog C-like isoform X2 n=1 Tax=Poecilia mexicana TaxID=48701 RepID=UPI00072EF01F|nr:PREDICTED: protein eva-1 homolog C-like isoform X2 [Poecilia mexicana]